MLTITHKKTLIAVQAILYALWPTTIWAARITLGESLSTVPLLAWLMVFILSTVSSLAALLNRLKVDTPPRLPLFVASHVVGSWLAGCLVFFAAEALDESWDLHDMIEAVAIALGSYAGARLMDRWADSFVNRVAGETERGNYGTKSAAKPE